MKRLLLPLGCMMLALSAVVGVLACWLQWLRGRRERKLVWIWVARYEDDGGEQWHLTWTNDTAVAAHVAVERWVATAGLSRDGADQIHATIRLCEEECE